MKGLGKVMLLGYIFIFLFSILPTGIDKTVLLVLCFWFPAPVWSFVFTGFFFLVALFFGLVYGLGIVFGGGIDCVENLGVFLLVRLSFVEDRRCIERKKHTSGVVPVLTN